MYYWTLCEGCQQGGQGNNDGNDTKKTKKNTYGYTVEWAPRVLLPKLEMCH